VLPRTPARGGFCVLGRGAALKAAVGEGGRQRAFPIPALAGFGCDGVVCVLGSWEGVGDRQTGRT